MPNGDIVVFVCHVSEDLAGMLVKFIGLSTINMSPQALKHLIIPRAELSNGLLDPVFILSKAVDFLRYIDYTEDFGDQ